MVCFALHSVEMWISAKIVLTGDGQILSPGAVRVEDDRITAIATEAGPRQGEAVLPLGSCVLSPGLINAHCHLDYTDMAGLLPTRSFTQWIKSINSYKGSFSSADLLASIARGFQLLIASGTTTVGNIEAFPELLSHLPAPPIRTWWFLELIDVRNRAHDDESLRGMLHFFDQRLDWLGGFGLSPHAPYTASIDLYRLAKHGSEQLHMPFTTHIAESLEEHEMFLYGSGPLHDFMQSLGRDCSDCGQGSALSHLLEHRVLTSQCLAVHLNYLQEYDWSLLVESQASVVHCPKCHFYFKHARFPLERMRALGINLCLGTDSLASNNTLDLRSEIRHARQNYPEVSDVEWWRMVTLNPARALGQEGTIGEIRIGAKADLVAFPLIKNHDPFISLIESRQPPAFLMVNGVPLPIAA